ERLRGRQLHGALSARGPYVGPIAGAIPMCPGTAPRFRRWHPPDDLYYFPSPDVHPTHRRGEPAMSVEEEIKAFIAREILSGHDEVALDLDYPLIEEKVLDSMDIQRLVAFVESQFGVTVVDDALLPENFATIRAIARMVAELPRTA